jgi:microcystin-dependent protein
MADFFIGEIRAFPFGFAPRGWHLCDGSLLQIQQNAALFSLLQTQFGGDGKVQFALPDLRGRTMLNQGTTSSGTYIVGVKGGAEAVALDQTQMPVHTHTLYGNTSASGLVNTPSGAVPATPASTIYAAQAQSPAKNMAAASLSAVGGGPHNNMQPSLVINYCISTTGIYPSRD